MAENRFESEMTRMVKLLIGSVGELKTEISGIREELKTEISGVKQELKKTNQKLDTLIGQFNDVAVMAIEDNKRITKLEGEVAELQSNIH
jgi:predicted  nucleic acid-binding Zn-ribbon protein